MTTCIIKSDNHSDDLIHIYSGNPYSIPVCGFHEQIMRGEQTIYAKAREIVETETKWIVWTEYRDGTIQAEIKKSSLAAKRAYNKIQNTHTLKGYGFVRVNDAEPIVRRAVGLEPFPKINVPIS